MILNVNTINKTNSTITNDKIGFTPSKYQQDILDAVMNGTCNILVDAKAGSGKTSTLKLIQNALAQRGEKCTILAFNKTIVAELEKKIPDSSMCFISTIASIGLKFVTKYIYAHKCQWYLRDNKIKNNLAFLKKSHVQSRTHQLCEEIYAKTIENAVNELYSSKLSKIELDNLHSSIILDLIKLCDSVRMHYDVEWNEYSNQLNITSEAIQRRLNFDNYDDLTEYIINNPTLNEKLNLVEMIRYVLQTRVNEFISLDGVENDGVVYVGIEYIDMVFFPVIFQQMLTMPKSIEPFTEFIMCDECQDMNMAQQKLLKRLSTKNTRYIFVRRFKTSYICICRSRYSISSAFN